MKQNITKYLGLQLMALALLPASSSIVHAQSPVAQEPVVVDTPFVHDPVMACENGTYYLYCTGHGIYNPQNEMFSHLGTKRYNFKNETQLFKVIPHTSKFQKNRPASPERNTFEGS